MDNKYGLGSSKVSHEHHDSRHKSPAPALSCRYCGAHALTLCTTMHDHRCEQCGQWQNDVPSGYSTGRSADY